MCDQHHYHFEKKKKKIGNINMEIALSIYNYKYTYFSICSLSTMLVIKKKYIVSKCILLIKIRNARRVTNA